MAKPITHIDEIINYPSKIINMIASSKEIVGLMMDDPNIDMDSDKAEEARRRMYDYDYIDDTIQEEQAVIMVSSEIINADTPALVDFTIYVQVVINKSYMKLDNHKFPGIKGNRCDNIVRQIDLLLNGSKDFGVSRLDLTSVTIATVPKKFTSRLLRYSVYDFGRDGRLLDD